MTYIPFYRYNIVDNMEYNINKNQLITLILLFTLQIAVWFQLNGQLIWKWFRDNPLMICILGMPLTYGFWLTTKYGYVGFGGLWPVRLLGFATGMLTFPFITYWMLGGGINLKTAISILLSIVIMIIQFI